MILRTAVTLLISSIALQLNAAPLDKRQIQFIGPIKTHTNIKPNNTAYQAQIIQSLLPSLQKQTDSVQVFGKKLDWQNLENVNALTMPGLQALKFNFTTTRFVQGKLSLKGIEKAHVFLDGILLSGKSSFDIEAVTGDHQVVVVAEQVNNWHEVSVDYMPNAEHDIIDVHQNKQRALSAKQLFDAPTISAISQSPDGQYYVISKRRYADDTANKAQTQTLLKDKNDKILYQFTNTSANTIAWRPDSKQVAYSQDGKVTLLNLNDLSTQQITSPLEGASGFEYFDENTLVFSWSQSGKTQDLVKHYQGLEDRWSYGRNSSQLYFLDTQSGLINGITEGTLSHYLEDHDVKRGTLLLSRSLQDYKAPPHSLTELVEFNITNGEQAVLGRYRTFNLAKYSKKGIYVVAGPDFLGGVGRTLPNDTLANNYDGQLYLLDEQGLSPKALSKTFDPAITSIHVLNNGDVLLKAKDEDRQPLFLFDESKSQFKRIKTGLDVVDTYQVTSNRSTQVLLAGTQASAPQQLKRVSLKNNRAETIWDSKDKAYTNTNIATLEEFNFKNKEGVEIKGRVYIPHGLDKTKKHPALIYYYGGTSPVSRAFTGRYPFNLWAANGYVVYVLQPTGATGFGQAFSAKHVNAWGEYTAQDIIDGTSAFIQAYPFVDKNRLGNLGASYGGFMTMLLATKTDMFSASISHAGISNITSYWGQGWWGYSYSGEASKNSFPWNNPTLYSQHSPVFHADKVTTPLLLLHGDADTNVPVGESHNMYTALKLLDKDVELIEYKNADHQIFARDRRFHWWNTILAYFDMHLKEQPQWWNSIYNK